MVDRILTGGAGASILGTAQGIGRGPVRCGVVRAAAGQEALCLCLLSWSGPASRLRVRACAFAIAFVCSPFDRTSLTSTCETHSSFLNFEGTSNFDNASKSSPTQDKKKKKKSKRYF
jgi:hypothetical protein